MKTLKWFLYLLVCISAFPIAKADQLPVIGYCDGCSTSMQWRVSAERASLNTYPIYTGTHEVYVVNRVQQSVRAFSVRRWFENGGVIPQSGGATERSVYRTSSYYRAEGTSIASDPVVEAAILDALAAVNDVVDQLKDGPIPIEELGLLPQIPSAIDLVGPADSGSGLNRSALGNSLSSYANETIVDGFFILYDLAQQVANQLLSDSMLNAMSTFIISFPDGTTIEVRLDGINETITGGDTSFTLDVNVLQHTAQGPGLYAVPQSAGQFSNFGYSGNGNVVAALLRLARRYGIPVNEAGNGGQSMDCEVVGDEVICSVNLSGY